MGQNTRRNVMIAGVAMIAIMLASSTFYLDASGYPGRPVPLAGGPSISLGSNQTTMEVVPESPPTEGPTGITVSGTGTVSLTPTEADVYLSVVTRGDTATGAAASNAAETEQVIKALNALGITNSSIQTTSYDLSPDHSYGNGGTPSLIGYDVTDSIRVNATAADSSQLGTVAGKVIDTAVTAGASQASLQFGVSASATQHAEDQALQLAVQDASDKGTTIASALGIHITGVISASDEYSSLPSPVLDMASVASAGQSALTPIVPGTLSVGASVQVTFAID